MKYMDDTILTMEANAEGAPINLGFLPSLLGFEQRIFILDRKEGSYSEALSN